jgi:hypothetical protein
MRACRQIIEDRQRNGRIAAGRCIVMRDPGARIHSVVERVVIPARQIRLHLELYIRHLRQGEADLHLTGRSIRRRAKVLVAAVVRPLDGLAARGRCIVYHHIG